MSFDFVGFVWHFCTEAEAQQIVAYPDEDQHMLVSIKIPTALRI